MSTFHAPIPPATRPLLLRVLAGWWTPVILLLTATILIATVWADEDRAARQQKNFASLRYAGIAVIASFCWFVFLSRAPKQLRKWVFLTTICTAILGVATLRIEGFSGDMFPILRWRWTARPDRVIEPITLQANNDTTAPTTDAKTTDNKNNSPTTTEHPPTSPTKSDPPPPAGLRDFPQFLGPARDGVITNLPLSRDWAAHPPRLLWRRNIGAAWSGFAIAGRRAITQEQRGDEELVVCYDITTGTPLWKHADHVRYDSLIAGIGPRATPTIAGNRVFACGATGILNAFDLRSGDLLWTVDLLKDTDAPQLEWGMAGSPLVEGDAVIINTGGKQGSVAAYNVADGKRRWIAGSGAASYASPCIITLLGTRQLVMQNQFTITGHALDDGRVLWSHDTPGGHPKVAQPLPVGENRLLVSSGYGTGSEVFELKKSGDTISTRSIWKNLYIKAKFANLVLRDGYIYGLNDGTLTCLKADTGERAWRGERYGHGQLLLVDSVLLLQAESGDVVLVDATHESFRELARFTAFTEKTWNSPTLAGKYLLVRNDREAACFELP